MAIAGEGTGANTAVSLFVPPQHGGLPRGPVGGGPAARDVQVRGPCRVQAGPLNAGRGIKVNGILLRTTLLLTRRKGRVGAHIIE